MATETDRVRREIEQTRAELSHDVDRLAEHANPGRMVGRVKEGMRSLKERVMGVSESASSTVGGAASTVADAASDVGSSVGAAVKDERANLASATRGSPLAVGLIAFGGGMLAAALVPETDVEKRTVQELSEHVGPVVEPLREAGRAFAADVRESVESAAAGVR